MMPVIGLSACFGRGQVHEIATKVGFYDLMTGFWECSPLREKSRVTKRLVALCHASVFIELGHKHKNMYYIRFLAMTFGYDRPYDHLMTTAITVTSSSAGAA